LGLSWDSTVSFSSWRLGWFNRAILNHQPILRVIADWSCFFNDVHLKSSKYILYQLIIIYNAYFYIFIIYLDIN
jgi:hypothetical protein